ncbi:uncharacterized protein LOC133814991 [Humulus lupulus]|uniref:uncharacterized protein LOC133814991 n=1 Tax=Humulus lupulus TaxID=3486 RepID=UPI002B41112F|nr:uncharacterized protein LOC133814991 [Humulus lupulus]
MSNRIVSYILTDGSVVDDYEQVTHHFLHHFQSFLGCSGRANGHIDMQSIFCGPVLDMASQLDLIKPFTFHDVKMALSSIHPVKSPGPDGYGASFFKVMWKEIGRDVSLAVLEFFETSFIPQSLNYIILVLIPKVDQPSNAADFRPIACCTTIYKCISKMLCSRLASILPSLINPNQGAFIKHRTLASNVLIFQYLIKGYNRKNSSPRCAMKIDPSKAYDLIDWDFLENLLKALCFPSRFIRWIMICLRGTSYSLLLNGRIQGQFKGGKGLRQGDPISPLLFVIVMDYLTRMLIKASNDKGLSINHSKSRNYFGGQSDATKEFVLSCTNLQEGSFPLKYLGVPLSPTKCKAFDFEVILKKIRLNFLWGVKGTRIKFHMASWEFVCRPKAYGGLGFRERPAWNKTMIAKFLWAISFKQDQLWVKWVNTIYLKGVPTRDYTLKQDDSGYWRKLIKLSHFVSRLDLEVAVVHVPKHNFVQWQAVNNHLLTRDLLHSSHVNITSLSCPVCYQMNESDLHLFFECIFSEKIRQAIANRLGDAIWLGNSNDWHDFLAGCRRDWLGQVVSDTLAVAVYFI